MNAQKLETLPPPPGVIGSLRTGFEVVSSHVLLILMPLSLDLFLWLGPRVSVNKLLNPAFALLFEQMRASLPTAQDAVRVDEAQKLMIDWLQRFNLISLLSRLQTFPIGISSLMSKVMPVDSPFGEQAILQVPSIFAYLAYTFLLVVIGWVVSGLYFRWVSGTVLGNWDVSFGAVGAIGQTFLLSVIWLLTLVALSIPILIVLMLLTVISPALASAGGFLMLVLSFWLIVPLYFTPHGIFVRRQNAFYSIYSSLRMARFTLPTSGLFVFSVFILSAGLNYLWSIPASDSWMLLFGLFGHAFITTALLAASFVYYRDMNAWLQIVLENLQQKNSSRARQA